MWFLCLVAGFAGGFWSGWAAHRKIHGGDDADW